MPSPKHSFPVTLSSADPGPASNNPTTPGDAHAKQKQKALTFLPLVALIFFDVSGGPFGTEDAVKAGGPLLVLLGFLILPLVWSVPEALITAELATAFPENSGYVAWVTAAFGPFWGFQEGFWSWLSGVTDNSIYPVLFLENLKLFFPQLAEGWPRMVFLITLSLLLTYMNYRGLHVVGNAVVIGTLFILLPFMVLTLACIPYAQPRNWTKVDWGTVQWGTYLNIMFWNLNYWDSVSTLAGEVDKPAKTFPKAMLTAVVLVVAFYFFPTLAALGVTVDSGDWELGYYAKVADMVSGRWLAWCIVVAAGVSQIGQFQAEMTSDAYQVHGMSERGFLPRVLSHKSKHGTPTYGILMSSVGVMFLASFNFVSIVELLNAIYCMAELLEFAAFVWLRVKAPDLPRPYKVPLPTWGLVVMLLPASALLLALLLLPIATGAWGTISWTIGAMVLGFVLYPFLEFCKENGYAEFADLRFDYQHPLLAPLSFNIQASGSNNSRRGSTDSYQQPVRAVGSSTSLLTALGEHGVVDRRRITTASSGSEGLMMPEEDPEAGAEAPLLAPAGAQQYAQRGERNGVQMTSGHGG